MRVILAPKIQFRCMSCKAMNEGHEGEFTPQHTMPPTWTARCGYCNNWNTVSPTPLIAKLVGSMF